jgi:hypothetical protein
LATFASLDQNVNFVSFNTQTRHSSRPKNIVARLIEIAAEIVIFSSEFVETPTRKHIVMQMLGSDTSTPPNYAQARGAEGRADFIHKLGIAEKN